MTFTELRYLVALAREKHFRRAAESCNVSQPTLSVAVKKAEDFLGVPLFERAPGDVRLTPSGEKICAQAEKVLFEMLRLKELAESGKGQLAGPLRLGVIYTVAPYLLPRLVPAMHSAAPDIALYLQENFTHNLASLLKSGELDAAIVAAPFDESGIVTRPLYDEDFCVAIPAGHPLCRETEISQAALDSRQLLILGQGNCFRDQVVAACPQLAKPGSLKEAMESSSLETLRYMVASGAGVAVVPATAAALWPKETPKESLMAIRPFVPPAPFRRVALAWRVTFPRTKAMEALYQAIRQFLPEGARAC
ncbi:MAG: LysR family transcriptional regulator [Zoogloeaceae bacterium]|nr:LysR family transcriptional regulator [Zoogloeaceae bacterium]